MLLTAAGCPSGNSGGTDDGSETQVNPVVDYSSLRDLNVGDSAVPPDLFRPEDKSVEDLTMDEKDLMIGHDLYGDGKVDLYSPPDIADGVDLAIYDNAMGQQHPIAVLDNCNERDKNDGKCIYRPKVGVSFCWYATGSTAPPGRNLVSYRVYVDMQNGAAGSKSPNSKICFTYGKAGNFDARLQVEDDTQDIGHQDFYNIVQ